jgi:hypothetical protein
LRQKNEDKMKKATLNRQKIMIAKIKKSIAIGQKPIIEENKQQIV